MRIIQAFLVIGIIFSTLPAFTSQKVVIVPLGGTFKINSKACPAATGDAIAGPTEMYNMCWYLSEDGVNCDKVCADLGGANIAYGAEEKWENNCTRPQADDVSSWFYNNGNPGNWTMRGGGTGYHTLGYGYDGGVYYGKCSTGTNYTSVSYPSEPNGNTDRNVVCPCFGLMKP